MKHFILSLFTTTCLLFLCSCDMANVSPVEPGLQVAQLKTGNDPETSGQLTVMTQNVYVGTDVDQILMAAPEEVPFIAAGLFQHCSRPRIFRNGPMPWQSRSRRPIRI